MRRGSGLPRWAEIFGGPPAILSAWDRIYAILSQAGLESYAGPGHWNDPDMLEVGNGKLTLAENRAHFSLWAMLAAPLLAGNDLTNMKPEVKDILTNPATSSRSIRIARQAGVAHLQRGRSRGVDEAASPVARWRLPC